MMSAGLARRGLSSIASSYLKIVSTYSCEIFPGHSAVRRDRRPLFRLGSRHLNCFGSTRSLITTPDLVTKQSKKLPRMTCREVGCTTTANYGWENGEREYCSKHKKNGMECLVVRLCEHHEKCIKLAVYGLPNGKPTHCTTHKHEGMLILKYKVCESPACQKQAAYGLVNRKPTHCLDHKSSEMHDVVSKRCRDPGCNKQPAYGFADGKRVYCIIHKRPGMVNRMNKRCEHPGYDKSASCGYAKDRRRRFCASHKLDGMLLLKGRSS